MREGRGRGGFGLELEMWALGAGFEQEEDRQTNQG